MLAILLLACSTPEPKPAAAPRSTNSALSEALEALQQGTPDVTPSEGEPPPTAPPKRAEPEPGDAECEAAKADREAYKANMQGAVDRLSAASAAASRKGAEMSECVFDAECAADGRRAEKLKKELDELEDKAAQASDALAVQEAGLFKYDQAVSKACRPATGDPRRR
ncbi:MAG: hypothetical protein VX899_22505 [Myxococcota bacterium]|nr:hypothetical protein [Myxococcota bacterium]